MTKINNATMPGLGIIICCIFLLLTGCPATTPIIIKDSPPQRTENKIDQLLRLAQNSPFPMGERYKLEAIELLIEQNNYLKAENTLNTIKGNMLPGELSAKYSLLNAKFAIRSMDSQIALDWLNNLPTTWIEQQSIAIQADISQQRAQAYFIQGQYYQCISELLYIAPLLSGTIELTNQTLLWQSLMAMPKSEVGYLLSTRETSNNPILQGWLELALIGKNTQSSLQQQLVSLNNWLEQWPSHPAANQLPSDLNLLASIANNRPNHIVLLLPLEGKLASAGKAIRDGFMVAYNETEDNSYSPELTVIDTSSTEDFLALHHSAVMQGAELIIGPLSKTGVQQLQSAEQLSVPTLALNYTSNNSYEGPPQLFQFGLAAEDEARQAAERAWKDGHRHAAIIAPESQWGSRISNSFTDYWELLGGKVVIKEFINAQTLEYSKNVTQLMHINESKQRFKQLSQLLKRKFEFKPTIRQDIDFIFLLASPQQARQIKPTLAYYYAKNIPIYATSTIFTGTPNPSKDTDLNGIQFCDIPWIFETNSSLKNSVMSQPEYNNHLIRLYALGIDSYYLHQRLPLLQNSPDINYYGTTGILKLDEQGKINRHLKWAEMRNGEPYQTPTVITNTNIINNE